MEFSQGYQQALALLGDHGWIVGLFAVVFSTLIVNFFVVRLLRRLYERLTKTRTFWDHVFVGALTRPLGWMIWVVGIAFAGEIAIDHIEGGMLSDFLNPVRSILLLGLTVWFFIRFLRGAEDELSKKKNFDRTSVRAICQILRLTVVITAGLIGMQTLGVPISGVLAFGGMGGLAVGFAAKDLLANFFGGLMIFLDRPFKVGDWINSPDRQIEGTVERIGWRLTTIRCFDKRPIYVPNSLFSTVTVCNPSRMTNRRIYTNIGLRYDDASKMATVLSDIEKMLRAHPEIDTNQTLMVNLIEFGPSSLDFMIYTFTKTTEWVKFQAIQQDVFLKVMEVIERHGAEVAFPTSTVHVPEGLPINPFEKIGKIQAKAPVDAS